MVDYCLQQNIIKSDQIKYVVLSSLSVPYDYYNEFIKFGDTRLENIVNFWLIV